MPYTLKFLYHVILDFGSCLPAIVPFYRRDSGEAGGDPR
jgi:hypothetical protein